MPESVSPQRLPLSRRTFIKAAGAAGAGFILYAMGPGGRATALAQVAHASLDPASITKFATPLLIPPVMPRAGRITTRGGKNIDYYEISMRQLSQQVLPAGMPATTVWGYGAVTAASKKGLLLHHAPSLTIEAQWNRPVRVKWINELVDGTGGYLSHLLPVDPTLHWANPPGGEEHRDHRPHFDETPGPYTGPVPIVTHVHGSVGVGDESDGYAEAWYLPAAIDIPAGYATEGTWYDFFATKAGDAYGVEWGPGFATFQYPSTQRASTIWYHDHTLGMTRLNVYAGPAGFFLIRGGPEGDDALLDARTGARAILPGPAPKEGDKFPPNKTYYEIPIAVQDRSFNPDGSLFYPDSREFFDGIAGEYIPEGEFSPIWNPEFFGETLIANGNTWPFQVVEQRRYRFRFLNGCQSRFLILDFGDIPGVRAWQIGNEGGFLAAPVDLAEHANRLLLGPAERADLVVDFAAVPLGDHVLGNVGPDEPFGGGEPGVDFPLANPQTTGQVLAFRVVPAVGPDPTTPPEHLVLPPLTPLPAESFVRPLALIEQMGEGVDAAGEPLEGPTEAQLGTVDDDGVPTEYDWDDEITENPDVGSTEVWEFFNTTGDAHPMHVHEVAFEVVSREGLVMEGEGEEREVVVPLRLDGNVTPPEPWETGVKDTVIAYPGQVTRLRATFDRAGQYVWHCHIVEHEDNEMMRPYRIGPVQPGQPGEEDD
ncbi:FtsP/CotA-like multicopper oxidase with cupredoxin domain [Agromyces flavus]|uniref:FtsP/CotA-like multicopper oxidase with cupredoxin domain n=1 Tax=Agromyces flavus TaxID=589382 RepID=A0A1H1YKW9_9MICO|nr:multicopper oxidase [Agromyces flavus]MCP2366724.1 FtsP/CotA-like multicopper oxidase with cupredoxin domain [Agromyces flavus]GGI45247.1 multicopper oxidase [Agromyces flavus]SDT22034.1 Multicopper oxidase with three cupredoxin domains (includes cell division protein FtsP and spore coat protein CotA) [Agromyces flavus]